MVRSAKPSDVDQLVALVSVTRSAMARLASSATLAPTIGQETAESSSGFKWLVVETSEGLVGAVRFGLIPCPPIYALAGQFAGILLDGFERGDVALRETRRLVVIAEAELKERGAAILLAASLAADTRRAQMLSALGYEPVTHFMLKGSIRERPDDGVRKATAGDVSAMVAMNAEARARLHEANSLMWSSHPDAEARFGAWMSFSLSMADRTMLVAPERGEVSGFIIAQPASPLQVPLALEREGIGLIDDFHCTAFGRSLIVPGDAASGAALLSAAESDLAGKGKDSVVAVCPVAWTAKSELLKAHGYAPWNVWFVKPAQPSP